MIGPLDADPRRAERIGRYTYLVRDGDGALARLVVASGERSAAARLRLARASVLRRLEGHTLVARHFPAFRREGPVHVDGAAVFGVVTDYLPGRDLTALAADANAASLFEPVGREIGALLHELHAVDVQRVVEATALCTRDEWTAHIQHWVEELAGRLGSCPDDVVVGRCSAASVKPLLPAATEVTAAALATRRDELWRPSVIHGDLHGGNLLAERASGCWRLSGVIDERLRAGDGLFDLAALMNWAYEVLPASTYEPFCVSLLVGYGAVPDAAARLLAAYQIERSLGRLAYYLPLPREQRRTVDPTHVRALHRHLDVLRRVSDAGECGAVLMADRTSEGNEHAGRDRD